MRREELDHAFTRYIESRTNRDRLKLLAMNAPEDRQDDIRAVIRENDDAVITDADLVIYGLLFSDIASEQREELMRVFVEAGRKGGQASKDHAKRDTQRVEGVLDLKTREPDLTGQ